MNLMRMLDEVGAFLKRKGLTLGGSGDLTLTGDLSAVEGTFSDDVNAVNGVFSGNVGGVAGTFTGVLSGLSAAITNALTAGSAAITGAITGATLALTGVLQSTVGAAAPAVAARLGASGTEGLELKVYDEVLDLTNAVVVDTNAVIPAGSIILSVQGNLEKVVVGDATGDDLLADIGLGIKAGDEDAYAEFGALTQDSKADGLPTYAPLASEVTISIFGLKVDGDTAATEKFVADTEAVRVRAAWLQPNSLDNV